MNYQSGNKHITIRGERGLWVWEGAVETVLWNRQMAFVSQLLPDGLVDRVHLKSVHL